jgi:hypothetical protein
MCFNNNKSDSTITCISIISLFNSTANASIITYENLIVHFPTSEECHLQRVVFKVDGHLLSPVAFRSVRIAD